MFARSHITINPQINVYLYNHGSQKQCSLDRICFIFFSDDPLLLNPRANVFLRSKLWMLP